VLVLGADTDANDKDSFVGYAAVLRRIDRKGFEAQDKGGRDWMM
jgi:hypothetical protein